MYVALPGIDPYPHQRRMMKAVLANKNVMAIIHRRAGKDICCLELWMLRALSRIGTHVYLFPLYSQARSVIWNGMDYSGKPFIDNIPKCLIKHKNEARMEITLLNGSRLVLAGSNNTDSLMGTNPVTIIYSEFALHHPLARQYLNPILIQNDGIEIIQSTPRGRNHCFEVYEAVRDNPKYHIEHLSIKETFKNDGAPIITDEQVTDARNMGMSEEMVQQEWFCNFNVGNMGAYYTREMSDMDREGRITNLVVNPHLPLHTVWDLGGTDSTAGLLFQLEGNYIHILFLLHDSGQGFKYYLDKAEQIRISVGCRWGTHFAPHDITQKHQGWEQAESRLMLARRAGWQFQVTPKMSFEDGIEAVRYVFQKLRIDKNNCPLAIRALREYQREYDDAKACFKPAARHDWTSHIADAVRYLAINFRRLYDIPQSPISYTSSM